MLNLGWGCMLKVQTYYIRTECEFGAFGVRSLVVQFSRLWQQPPHLSLSWAAMTTVALRLAERRWLVLNSCCINPRWLHHMRNADAEADCRVQHSTQGLRWQIYSAVSEGQFRDCNNVSWAAKDGHCTMNSHVHTHEEDWANLARMDGFPMFIGTKLNWTSNRPGYSCRWPVRRSLYAKQGSSGIVKAASLL